MDYSSAVKKIKAGLNQQSSSRTSSGSTSSAVENIKKGISYHRGARDFGFDTLGADIEALNNTINSAYKGWQPSDKMQSAKATLKSMYERLQKYQEHRKRYGGEDLSELLNYYKTASDNWDSLSKTYGNYKNMFEYEREKNKIAELNSMSSAELLEKIKPKTISEMTPQERFTAQNLIPTGAIYDHDVAYTTADGTKIKWEDLISNARDRETRASADFGKFVESGKGVSSSEIGTTERRAVGRGRLANTPKVNSDLREFALALERKTNGETSSNSTSYYDTASVFDKMTDKEVEMAYYYIGLDKKQGNKDYFHTENYMKSLMDSLNARRSVDIAKMVEDKPWGEFGFSIEAGLDQWASGMKGLTEENIPTSPIQYASGIVRENVEEDYGKIARTMYDFGVTGANMLPSIGVATMLSAIAPELAVGSLASKAMTGISRGAGLATMGASVKGNAYQEMLDLGYDKEQATTYSNLVAASEVGLEYLMGGFGKLGRTSAKISKAVSQIDNGLARFAIQYGGAMALEGTEEGLQEILTPVWKRIATGESESVDWGEVAYSTLLGAMMGGMYSGPGLAISTVSETARNKAIGQDIKANDRVGDVFDLANNPEIASAYEAYNRFTKKGITAENVSDAKLGRLYGMAYTDAQGTLDAKTSTMAQKDSAQGIIDNLEAYASRSMSSTLSDGTKGIVATDKSDATTKLVTGAKGIAETENSDMHKDADYVSALVESGLESAEGTEAHTLATEYSQKLKDGKKVSAKEVANLQNSLDKEIRAEEVKAVKSYLKENGHDVALAEAVTRQARGETITEAEAEAIEDSGIDIAKVEDAIVEYDGTATETETSEVAEASSEVSIPTEKIEELGLSPETVNVVERKAEGKGITISEAENLIKNEDALNVLADSGNDELVNLVKAITDEEGVDKATLFLSLYDGKTDLESFSKAFNLAVTKSEDNFPFDNIRATKGVLSDEQVKKIYAETRIKADQSKRASFQKLVDKTAKMKAYEGVVDDSVIDYENKSTEGKVNWKELPEATRKAVVFFKGLAKAIGMNLTFITDGKARGFNGEFSVDGNTITIDLFAKYLDFESGDIIESIVPAMSHELTHWMEKKSPVLFRKVSDIVFSTLEKDDGVTEWDRIANEIKKLTNKGELKETDSESKKIERARSEIVARACEGMLSQSKVGKEMFNSLDTKEQKTLIDKVKDIVKDILNWIEEALGIYKPTSYEAEILRKYKAEYEKLSKVWDKMLIESAEVNQALEKSGAFGHEVESIGSRDLSYFSEAVGTDGEKLFQHRAMVEDEDVYRAMLLKHKDTIGITNKQINELFATIDKAVDIISENLEALDYAWDVDVNDRAFSPVKPNSDSLYKVSLDFSTLCRKRLLQQTIAQTLQNALDKNLSTEESIAIRDELLKVQEEGRKIEVACALCYVESARMKSPKQINKFLNGREAIIKEFFANRSGGSIKEKIANAEMKARKALVKANPDGYYGKNDVKLDVLTAPKSHMKKADADYIRNEGKKAKASYKLTEHEQAELDSAMKMSVDDFTSAKGLENLAKNHPDLFDAYTSFVRNATHSKGIENDTWWRAGDSESIGDSLIAKMNEENGLRSQSWSDFQVIHLLDYIAATIELSTKGAKRQSYTKVPDYVKLLGNTGDMINMSLIPARVFNGKLEYDSVEGMAYDIAKQLRDEYHETVGTICIGINNEQIQMLLDDITIDMVIPYHHSSMSKAVRKLMHIPAWETYQNYQGEKNLSDAEAKARAKEYGVKLNKDSNYQKAPSFSEWFNLEEARQIAKLENANPSDMDAYKKYGKMYGGYMAMRNAADKYLKLCAERGLAPKFSSEKADFTHDANYWKLLIDRKMVDNVTGEIIEQKAIKPIFNEKHVLEILTDELARYPEVKADQEYATRKVTEKFLSGEMKVDKSTLEAIKKPIDNVTKVNILESSGEVLHSERVDVIDIPFSMYSTMEEHFGTTKNYEVAGYLLTDGKMLDFSGKHWGDSTSNFRQVDHRDIQEVLEDEHNGVQSMVSMISNGNIRLMPEVGGINLAKKPNGMQTDVLRGYINHFKGEVKVDIDAIGGDTIHSFEYSKGTSASKILSDLDGYFNKGEIPTRTKSSIAEFLYSERADINVYDLMGEAERLNAENAKLDADAEKLNGILGTEEVANKKFLALANYLKKISGSAMDSAKLGKMLKTTYTSMQSSENLTWESIASLTDSIAESVMNNDLGVSSEYFKKVMFEIRKDKISLSKEQRARVEERFGSYGNFHKYVFGRINVTNDGKPLSDIWGNWSKLYPSLFDAKADGAEQIDALLDAVDALKATSTIMGEYEHQEAIRHLSTEIYNQFWNIATDSATVEEAQVYRTEHKALMTELRKDYEQRQKDLAVHPTGESALKYESLLRKFQETKRKEIAKAKEHGREMMDKYKENASKKTLIQRVTAKSKSLRDKIEKNNKDKHIPEVFKGPVLKLLTAIDFSSKTMLDKGVPTSADYSFVKVLADIKNMYEEANAKMITGLEDLYGRNLTDQIELLRDSMYRLVGDNHYVINAMSVEELRGLNNLLDDITNQINKYDKFHTVQHLKGIIDLAQSSSKEMDVLGTLKYKGKAVTAMSKLDWNITTPYYAFRRYGESAMKIFEAFMDGDDKIQFLSEKVTDFTKGLYSDKDIREWEKDVYEFNIVQRNGDEVSFKMNLPQIMELYCSIKQEDAAEHFINGITLPKNEDTKTAAVIDNILLEPDDYKKIISKLDLEKNKKAKEVAEALHEYMGRVGRELIDEVFMARWGIKMNGVKNYYPLKVSEGETDDMGDAKEEKMAIQKDIFSLINAGFTKNRKPGADQSILIGNIFDTFATHMAEVITYNAMTLPILDAMKWYNYRGTDSFGKKFGVRKSMLKAFGKDGANYLTQLVKDINGVKNTAKDGIYSTLLRNYKIATVGASVKTALLQPTAYAKAYSLIDAKYLARAFKLSELVTKKGSEKAQKYCGIALRKAKGYGIDINIGRGLANDIKHYKTRTEKLRELSMKMAEKGDNFTFGCLWNACELEIRDKRKDLKVGSKEFYEEIGKRLREVVYATQVADSTLTRCPMMRSEDGKLKEVTMFMSEPILANNIVHDAFLSYSLDKKRIGKDEAKSKHRKRIARVLTGYVLTNAFAAVVETASQAFFNNGDDDDDEFNAMKEFLINFGLNLGMIGKIPYFKEFVSHWRGFDTVRVETQAIKSFYDALDGWAKVFSGKVNQAPWAIRNTIRSVSDVFGQPIYNVYKQLIGLTTKLDIFTVEDLNEMFEDFID